MLVWQWFTLHMDGIMDKEEKKEYAWNTPHLFSQTHEAIDYTSYSSIHHT